MLARRNLILALSLLAILGFFSGAEAQGAIELIEQSVDYRFNEFLRLEASFDSDSSLIEGHVFFHAAGQQQTHVNPADLQGNRVRLELALGDEIRLPAGSLVSYWFVVANEDGNIFESETFTFNYDDNRYEWREMEDGAFRVRWHAGDEAFASAILSAARKGVNSTQQILPLDAPEKIEFVAYEKAEDVQLVLQLAGHTWLAGHSDPEFGRVLLSLSPSQSLEIERQVPHEVAHLMLYQNLGAQGYGSLPTWLNEGIAAEAELYSDPLRDELLVLANSAESLPTFFSLCQAFPQHSSSNRLAYAQSASFVRYLREKYGEIGFEALVEAYASSGDCLEAPVEVFGENLIALESGWRLATFDPDSDLEGLLALAPWQEILFSAAFVILIVVLLRSINKRTKR